jgi:hypothetical protein
LCYGIRSNFGILLDSKIIKFNQGGVWLKDVEIGSDYISLTCSTEGKIWTIRLFHGEIGSEELERIAEKFRFETGVVPKIME